MADKPSWERLLLLAGLLAATAIGWQSRAAFPVRLLVTFVHESGHVAGALASGGSFDRLRVESDGSARLASRGGAALARVGGGYFASLLVGFAIIRLAARPRAARLLSLLMGLALAGLAASGGRAAGLLWYALACAAVLASGPWWLPDEAQEFALRFVGSASCLYPLFDLRVLQSFGHGIDADAALLSEHARVGPPQVWAAAVALLAVVWTVRAFRLVAGKGR